MYRHLTIFFLLFLALFSVLPGCSSSQKATEHLPVESTESYLSALGVCKQHAAKIEFDAAGLEVTPVGELKPWVRCFEFILKKYPEARKDEEFVSFFRSLQARHVFSPSDDAIKEPSILNKLVLYAIGRAEGQSRLPGDDLLRYSAREFPRYYEILISLNQKQERKSEKPVQVRPADVAAEMGELNEPLELLNSVKFMKKPKKQSRKNKIIQSQEDLQLCRQYHQMVDRISDLKGLIEYQIFLRQMARSGGDSSPQKVEEKVESMKKELLEQKKMFDANTHWNLAECMATWK